MSAKKDEPDEIMLEIMDKVAFFTDKSNCEDVYVEYNGMDGKSYFERPNSTHFRSLLSYEYRERTGLRTKPDFQSYVDVKCEDAIAGQGAPVTLCHRLTGTLSKKIIYFLGGNKRQCVIIRPDKDKWFLTTNEKIKNLKFLQTNVDQPQVKPVPGGNYLDLLRPYINLADDDFKLLAICIAQFFSRQKSHYALILSSDKGTGKSTLTKLIQDLVDPSKIGANIMTNHEKDLKTHLSGTYLACFDNTKQLRTDVSNLLCSAITGATAVKRKLYTDSDQVILNLHNVIILNGIDIIPSKSDLVDRSLLFELRPISKAERQTDNDYWNKFKKDKPAILGAIFDTLKKAMDIFPTLNVDGYQRMADANEEMIAIAKALGISEKEFSRILQSNRDRLDAAFMQNDPFIEHILDYMSKRSSGICAPATEVFKELKNSIVGATDFFPKSPARLSHRLKQEESALSRAGYVMEKKKGRNANYIVIKPVPKNQQTKAQKEAISARAKVKSSTPDTK